MPDNNFLREKSRSYTINMKSILQCDVKHLRNLKELETMVNIKRLKFKNSIIKENLDENTEKSAIELFKRMTDLIEKHFNIPEFPLKKILDRFKRYILEKYDKDYIDLVVMGDKKDEVKHLCKNFCDEINSFLKVFGQTIVDFYLLDKIKYRIPKYYQEKLSEVTYKSCEALKIENIMSFLTTILFSKEVYQIGFCLFKAQTEKECENFKLAKKYMANKISLESLGVEQYFRLNESKFEITKSRKTIVEATSTTMAETREFSNTTYNLVGLNFQFNKKHQTCTKSFNYENFGYKMSEISPGHNSGDEAFKNKRARKMSDNPIDTSQPDQNNLLLSKNISKDTWQTLKGSTQMENRKKSLLADTLINENIFMSPISQNLKKNSGVDLGEVLELRNLAYEEATDILKYLKHFENPFQKMSILLSAKNLIYREIKNSQESESIKTRHLDAHNQMLILEYLLFNSDCDDIPAHLAFVREFLPRNYKLAVCGHYLTVYQIATNNIITKYLNYVDSQEVNQI